MPNRKNQNRRKNPSLALTERKSDRTLVYRGIGFPDEYYTDLYYTYTASFNTSSFQVTQMQSSLYDPLSAIGGSQPTFFDQLSAVYSNYQVLGMTAEVDIAPYTSTDFVPLTVAWAWTKESVPATSVDNLSMTRYSGSRFVGGTGAPPLHVSTHMDLKKLFGYRDITEVDALSAAVTSNPSQMCYFTVGLEAIDGATTVQIYCRIRMRYRCRLFGLVTPSPS